ncbi:MAG: hypothetical protein WHS82_00365 [Candidatus Methanosuratincola sp.]
MNGKRAALAISLFALVYISTCLNGVRGEENSSAIQERFQIVVGEWLNFFQANLEWFASTIVSFMKYAVKTLYFAVGLAGFVMWASGFSRYTGKKLIIGAIAMAIVSEMLL